MCGSVIFYRSALGNGVPSCFIQVGSFGIVDIPYKMIGEMGVGVGR